MHDTTSASRHSVTSVTNGLQTISYRQNRKGIIEPVQGEGWAPVNDVNRQAWLEIEKKVHKSKEKVNTGRYSCLHYYMTVHQMTPLLLARSTRQSFWQVLLHLVPFIFKRLPPATLQKYSDLFQVAPHDLQKGRMHSALDSSC